MLEAVAMSVGPGKAREQTAAARASVMRAADQRMRKASAERGCRLRRSEALRPWQRRR